MFFFIPYGTDRPARSFPFITYTLIAINVIVFAWQYGVSNSDAVMDRYAFIPNQLNGMSWFTYMFLHGGLSHLAGNMLYLWLFGCALECALGWWIFLPTYLLSGCVAMMLHYSIVMATDPVGANTHLVGASGAIAGLLGMYALRFYQTRIRIFRFPSVFHPLGEVRDWLRVVHRNMDSATDFRRGDECMVSRRWLPYCLLDSHRWIWAGDAVRSTHQPSERGEIRVRPCRRSVRPRPPGLSQGSSVVRRSG